MVHVRVIPIDEIANPKLYIFVMPQILDLLFSLICCVGRSKSTIVKTYLFVLYLFGRLQKHKPASHSSILPMLHLFQEFSSFPLFVNRHSSFLAIFSHLSNPKPHEGPQRQSVRRIITEKTRKKSTSFVPSCPSPCFFLSNQHHHSHVNPCYHASTTSRLPAPSSTDVDPYSQAPGLRCVYARYQRCCCASWG